MRPVINKIINYMKLFFLVIKIGNKVGKKKLEIKWVGILVIIKLFYRKKNK
jgi:hypothetical protein